MDKNIKGILMSIGAFVAGCILETTDLYPLGMILLFGSMIAVVVFLVLYIVEFCKKENDGYLNIVKHAIFTLITCGIYAIYWYYRTTDFFAKERPNEYHKSPMTEMLLSAFVPFYHVYWAYLSATEIEHMYAEKGIIKDIKVPAILLAVFLYWWGGSIYIQAMLNDCVMAKAVGGPIETSNKNRNYVKSKAMNELDATTALKNYKELLDQGIITQEEFDVKKKELLGL